MSDLPPSKESLEATLHTLLGLYVRKSFTIPLVPLRRSLDYQSIFRKTFIVEKLFKHTCIECKMGWNGDDYQHTPEECAAYGVHET